MTRETRTELESLLALVCDGGLGPAERGRMEFLLRDDPECRRFYLAYIDLHAGMTVHPGLAAAPPPLPESLAALSEPPRFRAPAAPPTRQARSRWAGRSLSPYAAAAVVAGAIAVLLGGYDRLRRTDGPPVAPGDAPESVGDATVAVLTRTVEARWADTGMPTTLGAMLPVGRMELTSGLAQLEFFGGAIVVLEGPADLELVGTDRAFCRRGRLRVRAPAQPEKFTVETPSSRVIDLGTEFGVRVDEAGGAAVHVFDGKVQLQGKADAGADGLKELGKGMGASIGPDGVARVADVKPGAFVGPAELARRSSTDAQRRHHAWSAFSRGLRADPRVLVYFSFEGQQAWERTLRNQAGVRENESDGAIVGCEWAEGRWPGKGALEFGRLGDRVRFHVPGEFEELTVAAWVRVDRLDHSFNALMLSDGAGPGTFHWQLTSKGKLYLAVVGGGIYTSPVVVPARSGLRLWKHLATVYDLPAGTVSHYVDGRLASSHAVDAPTPARVGWAELGNWGIPRSGATHPVRRFEGRMDEFVVFGRAVPAEEIGAMFEAGRVVGTVPPVQE